MLRSVSDPSLVKAKEVFLGNPLVKHLMDSTVIQRTHEELLFLQAFPESKKIYSNASARLSELDRMVSRLSVKQRKKLDDTGLFGTTTIGLFGFDTTSWLLEQSPHDTTIDWSDWNQIVALEKLLKQILVGEADSLFDQTLDARDILRIFSGGKELRWIIKECARSLSDEGSRDTFYDALQLTVSTRHTKKEGTTTWSRFPKIPLFINCPENKDRRKTQDILRDPIKRRPLSHSAKQGLLNTCRWSLVSRRRETDPVIHGTSNDVQLYDAGRGISVALIGMRPERRLAIEGYIGFVAAKNGTPVSYGGAWILGSRAEIGINIFDTFRGGDSVSLFLRIMAVYQQVYSIERVFVDSYQFGDQNEEGITSEAIWFYYKMGFRHVNRKLRSLAEYHWKKKAGGPRRSSSRQLLLKLASGPIVYPPQRASGSEISLPNLAIRMGKKIADRFDGDRKAAYAESLSWLERISLSPLSHLRGVRRDRAMHFALIFSLIPDVSKWSIQDKRGLGEIALLKGGASDSEFLHAFRKHRKIEDALKEL